jgi:hypothetical protein
MNESTKACEHGQVEEVFLIYLLTLEVLIFR